MTTFIGFTTIDRRTGTTTLEDKELAKRDLLNHFYTRRGERLGEPEFGSILPELVFEPFDQRTIDLAEEDVATIINLDPRWELQDVRITTGEYDLTVEAQIIYVSDLTADTLLLNYTATEEI